MEELKNKVAASGLITIDLERFYPDREPTAFDIKDFLFMEMLLKEKDFREALDQHDWSQYAGKTVAVFCSTDAIIPLWAHMLIASKLTPFAERIVSGNIESAFREAFIQNIRMGLGVENFDDKRVVIKGCGDKPIPDYAYMEASKILLPVVKSLMYGEPCSTVPVFKKK
jgi:hypothetical protein